jgi:hypothetical protein|tara:strand:+ start:405 stop:1028 length:624 start_codon:yes stop_codon:yes gene_type:complete
VLTLKKFISEQCLDERYVNAIGDRDIDLKNQYKKQVWDLLQSSYAKNGGLMGSGFQSMEIMVQKIPMWKMVINNGTVEAVVMYKDKGGRKSVAMGSTGSPYAKKAISNLFPAELQRSYGEKSKSALGALMKIVPWSVLEPYAKTPAQVKKVSKDTITSLKDFKGTLPDDAKATLTKFPVLQPYGYFREIGGKLSFKVMIGTPGKTIK